MSERADSYFELSDAEVILWVEQAQSLCLKALTPFGDPVELSEEEARALAAMLNRFADEIDAHK